MTLTNQDQLPFADPPPYLGPREVTPLSVLQGARADWQKRKKEWANAGLTGDSGRDHISIWPTTTREGKIRWQRAVSVFDPHLTDLHYHWYCPPVGRILDPFAGGATRGLVAAVRGYHYTGIDLSPIQVEANRAQYQEWKQRGLITGSAEWIVGAAQDVLPRYQSEWADYVLTCPPYHSLERYSDHPQDLSVMEWEEFVNTVGLIVEESERILKGNRFATWVTGDIRDKAGHLRRLPTRVDDAHEQAGFHLVNDTIIASPLGGKFGVIWRNWNPTRSATRIHQYAHTFVKGDRRCAASACTVI